MSDPFIGEIKLFAINFVPRGWFVCNGQSLSVQAYQPLYAVIGNRFGGNTQTFSLPNLNGKAVVGTGSSGGSSFNLAHEVGSDSVTLNTSNDLPYHTHQMSRKSPKNASSKRATPTATCDTGVIAIANGNVALLSMGSNSSVNTYLAPNTIGSAFGNATGTVDPHENRQPFLALCYAIAYDGIYPSRPS